MPVSTKLQVRRDNAATWTSQNPILAAGEIGFETDNLRFKIGNGSNTWANLAYQAAVFNGGTITNALVVSNTTGVNTSGQFISTIATGTAPFVVSSTTRVANLNVATSGAVITTVSGTTSADLVYGNMADNDQFRIRVGGTATNAGFAEIATADDGTEPIHVRQYTGVFTTLARTATLLDESGNTTFPGTVSGTRFISNVATGTAPLTVTSTTQVANLNVATSGTTSNVLGGAAGRVLFQSAANTTAFLTAPATNNSFLTYNTATSAPEWDSPPLTMAVLTGYTATVTAAGTTTLTNASSYYQFFSGTTTQTVVLPVTSTLQTGWTFHIVNNSTGLVTVNSSGGNAVIVIPAGTTAMITCIGTTLTTAADWESGITDFSTYTGSGAVVMNNTPTFTTPNIGAATGTSLNVTGQLISTQATGTAPFVVSSTTQVANLNAATTSISVNIGAGDAGSLPYQTAANTTAFLARTATNNSTLAFNSSTNAPFWIQPTLSNTYYAATTSAQIAGVVSDETGSGALVFGTTPTITPANAVVATSATQAGYIGMPQNSQSGAYTLAAGDAGKHIYYTTTGQTVTIPNNTSVAFQIGTAITFITAPSVSLSIAITTDTLRLANTTTTGTRTLAANGVATAIKVTSTAWIISGNGLT